jgi:hypothetical protein
MLRVDNLARQAALRAMVHAWYMVDRKLPHSVDGFRRKKRELRVGTCHPVRLPRFNTTFEVNLI